MLTINEISIVILVIIWTIIIISAIFDYGKKRVVKEYPAISFIVPCYNSEKTIKDTIKSIYDSYDGHEFEVIVIEDKSTDDSLYILRGLQKKYGFKLIINNKNLGKANSINRNYKKSKYDLIWMVDSDIIINKEAIYGILARFQTNPKLVAANCAYKMRNKGWFARMQQMECSMMSFILMSHNAFSTLYLWGGCLAIKKAAFEKVRGYSENMLTEDADLAFKLKEQDMYVEHSMIPVSCICVDNFKGWCKQKSRWISGTVQCYIKHVKVWIRHPLHIIFLLLFSVLSIIFIILLLRSIFFLNTVWKTYFLLRETTSRLLSLKAMGWYYGLGLIKYLTSKFYFAAFSAPYTVPMMKNFKEAYKILYIFPFAFIYFPALSILALISVGRGIINYIQLRDGGRAW